MDDTPSMGHLAYHDSILGKPFMGRIKNKLGGVTLRNRPYNQGEKQPGSSAGIYARNLRFKAFQILESAVRYTGGKFWQKVRKKTKLMKPLILGSLAKES
jgi:hypothetical protein